MTEMVIKERWVSLNQAARETGYNPGTLSNLAKRGRLPSRRGIVEINKVIKVRIPAVLVNIEDVLEHRKQAKEWEKRFGVRDTLLDDDQGLGLA